MASTTISKALCGVMEQALIEKGIDATLAKALAERACEPALGAVPGAARKVGRAVREPRRLLIESYPVLWLKQIVD